MHIQYFVHTAITSCYVDHNFCAALRVRTTHTVCRFVFAYQKCEYHCAYTYLTSLALEHNNI